MTIKEFIEKMCKEFYEIGQNHPYWGFLLIGEGIEFLGACLDNGKFDLPLGYSRKRFSNAMENLVSLNKFHDEFPELYVDLRCALTHGKKPKHLALTEYVLKNPDTKYIDFNSLYNAFEGACNELLNDEELWSKIKLTKIKNHRFSLEPIDKKYIEKKHMNKFFLNIVTDKYRDDRGCIVPVSGVTVSYQGTKLKNKNNGY